MAQKKRKFMARGVRGARALRNLADSTQKRVQAGLTSAAAAGGYNTNDLLDDVMEQWTDVMTAVGSFATGSDAETPTVYLLYTPLVPLPLSEPMSLNDSVAAGNLDRTDLAGPVVVTAGPPLAVTANAIPRANYTLLHVDGTALGANDEVERILVRLTVAPPAHGIYRGLITLQSTRILAEVVVLSRP